MLSFAVDTYKKIVRAERRIEKLNTELKKYIAALSDDDVAEYEKITRLWEQGQ